jgi:hypothetical protein
MALEVKERLELKLKNQSTKLKCWRCMEQKRNHQMEPHGETALNSIKVPACRPLN